MEFLANDENSIGTPRAGFEPARALSPPDISSFITINRFSITGHWLELESGALSQTPPPGHHSSSALRKATFTEKPIFTERSDSQFEQDVVNL